MSFEISDIISLVIFIGTVMGFYFDLKSKIREKVSKEDYQKTINGIKSELQKGLSEIRDIFHEQDKQQAITDMRLKALEEKET